jgi:hypothetical protein
MSEITRTAPFTLAGLSGTSPLQLAFRNPDAPQHVVQFYSDESSLIDNVSAVVATALQVGESAIIIATRAHLESVDTDLRSSGLNLDSLQTTGRYFPVNAEDLLAQLMDGVCVDEAKFDAIVGELLAKGAQRSQDGFVLVFGELVTLLCAADNPGEAVRLEQLWNALIVKHQCSLYCAYPVDLALVGPTLDRVFDICSEHSITMPVESWQIQSLPAGSANMKRRK